ncbi:YtxH domain-containing protein [Oceanobacillus massiliensis]|uniref:YtxH domain-containing protein n=1 Tax=Oceanobacillus massiliensis TaxID=1465765 RepID=UPI0002E12E54|nr:YtxH domain-containing protein [Oceanobacillus massiliensis]
MSKGKSLVLGLLVGSTVGAAVTLLSTPESGYAVRGRVRDQGMELKNLLFTLKEDGLRLKDQLKKTSKEGAVLMKDLTEEIKKSVEDWKETVEPHQESIYQSLEQIETSLKDLEDKMKNQ